MVFGVLPLVVASGAGAAGRTRWDRDLQRLSIGTLFTLFVVPAMYMFLAGEHKAEAKPSDPAPAQPSPQGVH
jgi:multidrug efflux pump